MAIMFVRAQMISRGAGRNIISAASYRHRTRMRDGQTGISFNYRGGDDDLVHEELALPDDVPGWLRLAIDGKTAAGASEVLWNAVDAFEKRADAQLARELIIALPEELTRAENIALVREFVRDNLTAKGMIADWVYHDKDGDPHIHLLTALRPLTETGFGPKYVPVLRPDGKPLREVKSNRHNGDIVYTCWAGDKETMKAWKLAWAETASRYLALSGHDIRLDGRSYAEQGLDGIAQKHLGPAKTAMSRKGVEMYFAPAELARRQEMADRLLADPGLLLKRLGIERSTFDEKDIARTLHRYVDDPGDFANIRSRLMASDDLVLLKPQQVDRQTGKANEPAIFTTREILRVEYDMARSAEVLSKRKGFGIAAAKIAAGIQKFETADPGKSFKLDLEQIDAIRHVTGDSAISTVVGLAGAGKSTLLATARIAWENERRDVFGAALSGKAAEGLEDSSGIKSRTLAAWELGWENGRDLLKRGDIFVVDEAAMVSSEQMARVLKAVENAGAKAVLVGDAMQLQPIQAGAAFRAITERIGFAELAGVRRQREAWARDASRLFAQGKVEEGLDAYAQKGHIIEAKRRAEVIERLVADWNMARREAIERSVGQGIGARLPGDEMLVLAHTNKDVRRLNESLRIVMHREGALTNAREFRTERGVREFGCGDRVIFLENARLVEKRAKHLGPQYVKNGMLGTVVSTGGKGGRPLLSIRLDTGRDVVLSEDSYRNIDHGYAVTIHKSQGVTVGRTFVLATGMMDQHLTYVSMTRHRDRADLYATREDFEPKAEWGGKSRVDHAAGVTGELTGMAKFRPQDKDADESPYADVKRDDGTVHRLWGVSLPKALSDGGVSEGDTALLRKDGVEIVKVKIPVTDNETGRKSFEEREVERKVWTAKQLETAIIRSERIERESHRPELFGQLVERLGRSGAKTTTLDFENEAGYRAYAHDFARRRGIDTLAGVVASIEERVGQKLAWLDDKRGQVAKLWERASVALDIRIEREKSVSYNEQRSPHLAVRPPEKSEQRGGDGPHLLPSIIRFVRSLEEDARRAQLQSDRWKEREVMLRPVLEKVYSKPDGALARLNAIASNRQIEPRGLAEDIAAKPERLGLIRGSGSLFDSRAARYERKAALSALADLVALARAHATEFRRQAERFDMREEQRRAYMALSIPALSKQAMARLVEIEAVRERGGSDAYKTAFAHAAGDRQLVQQVKAINEALTARFGWSAFTDKADAVAERNILERMPENLDPDRREKLTRLFTIIRRFAEEQHLAETRGRSKVVAAASIEPCAKINAVLPMLTAVTEFKTPIEDEAKARALTANHYQYNRAALAKTASNIWRDPAGAVDKIEALIIKGFAAERIAAAVANDPAAYGALRGSDRIMDKFLASGRERKEALLAVSDADSRVRSLGASYATALSNETKAITGERQRMGIAIPGLSPAAEVALRRLTQTMKKKGANLKAEAGLLHGNIIREFATVSRALDLRFGRDAILRSETTVTNSVAPTQRRAFETMQEDLKILQQTVRMQASQKIVAERQRRALERGRGITY
ncbi:Ti-type conjugative transfer relaxase TraA [Ochrobactrum sp. 19YEA23]|uniref:Ti-type conjugative transfer relaxase TraA n=1 Tax=Ochrobactrum sp. 19YEA23 TaxID=3039854 RepID=UPI002478E775|nr:Ti-type conjugative transfer relaxase TraA [Ochrobactrum sp. 19YEA23]